MVIENYKSAYQRWTWQRRKNASGLPILSPVLYQFPGGCSAYAVASSLEANCRAQELNYTFSRLHLHDLARNSKPLAKFAGKGRVWRILEMVKDVGVMTDDGYELAKYFQEKLENIERFKISKWRHYNVHDRSHLKSALCILPQNGPLICIVRVSHNYEECLKSKKVYRFDPSRPRLDKNRKVIAHALSVVGFSLEPLDGVRVPCLICQNSDGPDSCRGGFLHVDMTSIKELYSVQL